ncbi:MAG: NifB/NifX family molybdenum-iron cluster-binding protein [Candidatus Methanoplasma sp.]|jgi:predicted Fe-Mo cluster-binding NifX family protein|nr:NifB/NifX family molybdenum-iron cluster-binding protein [Candidatus Methanoplasma sp.]
MKIGVISEGDTLESFVAEDFGHAPFFLIVDSETMDYTVVKNEFADAEGAGMKVADAIVSLGVDAVITGGIGSHGINILNKAGIKLSLDEEGTVWESIRDFKRRAEFEAKFQ